MLVYTSKVQLFSINANFFTFIFHKIVNIFSNMGINERFKAARLQSGLSQEQIATKLSIGRAAISKIESGSTDKPNIHYAMLLKEHNISLEWLLYGKGEMMEKKKVYFPEDYEEIKKENSYLRKEVEQLKEQMKAFLTTINHLSGKPSEHKPAAFEIPIFGKSKSYVPATN